MPKKTVIEQNKITIPSQPELIIEVDQFVESRLREKGITESLIADLAICATELVNNGIIHGNKEDPEKLVTLQMDFQNGEVRIIVTDQGESFSPDNLENPIEEKNLLREAGRGIFIVRELMDAVDIRRRDNGGTTVIITKKLS